MSTLTATAAATRTWSAYQDAIFAHIADPFAGNAVIEAVAGALQANKERAVGDMREEFDALRAHKREQREARAVVNTESLRVLGVPATEQSKNVFWVNTPHGAVMYYPTSGKWQHKGKVMWGNVQALQGWLRNQRLV